MTMTEQERREAIEHRETLIHLRAVLATDSGREVFKYFMKHFEVGKLPALGIEGSLLMDKIGTLRAGAAIFEILSEANPDIAGNLLAQIERERYAEIYAEARIGTVE